MSFHILTKKEAAERARISRTMLDKQIRLGVGPAVVQIGRSTRIRSDALEEWLVQCTKRAGAKTHAEPLLDRAA